MMISTRMSKCAQDCTFMIAVACPGCPNNVLHLRRALGANQHPLELPVSR